MTRTAHNDAPTNLEFGPPVGAARPHRAQLDREEL